MFDRYHDGIYILAISGGPDSMAMLHMAVNCQINIVVCHVNYHQRESSDFDESVVRSFCALHGIPVYVKHASKKYRGNFQHYARTLRYEFFNEVYIKYNAKGLFTAHHRDDFLETAILRKQQKRYVSFYGIREETSLHGMRVIRPLLHLWKQELMDYCVTHKLAFGIDESNQKDHYERNRIRLHQLNKLTLLEKEAMIQNFEVENRFLEKRHDTCNFILEQLQYREQLPLRVFQPFVDQALLLRLWLASLHKKAYFVSEKQIQQMIDLASSQHGQKEVALFDNFVVKRIYDVLYFSKKVVSEEFCVTLSQREEIETPWFKVHLMGNIRDGITVTDDDFPLTIRNVMPGDSIHFSFGHKKLHRYFIDHKIPMNLRKMWPVVCNRRNEVIFACGLGSSCEYFTNTPNLFVVK